MNEFDKNLKQALIEHEKEIISHHEKLAQDSTETLSSLREKKILNILKKKNIPLWRQCIKFGAIAAAFIFMCAAILTFFTSNKSSLPMNPGPGHNDSNYLPPAGSPEFSDSIRDENRKMDNSIASMDETQEPKQEDGGSFESSLTSRSKQNFQQKLIYRFNLTIETLQFEHTIQTLEQMVRQTGGYIEQSELYDNGIYSKGKRSALYVVRVPKPKTTDFIAQIPETMGQITNKTQSVENVTRQYQDTSRQVEISKIKEERLLDLLKKAEKMEDILLIEERLANLIAEREYRETALLHWDHEVDYDSITLDIIEVKEPTKIKQDDTFGDRIQNAFDDSLTAIRDFFRNMILYIVRHWFGLLIFGIFIIGVALFTKKIIKRYRS